MPRRSSSPSLSQKKITTPLTIDYKKNLPAVIVAQKPSFLQTMKEGVALGVGSSIGHRIIGSILGHPNAANISSSSVTKNNEYEQCMKDNNDKAACEYLLKC
jgi:hypothetical protein